jgi:hypothetical protein
METIYGDRCDRDHQACPTRCVACLEEEHDFSFIDDLGYINALIEDQEKIAPWGPTKDSYSEYSPARVFALCQKKI